MDSLALASAIKNPTSNTLPTEELKQLVEQYPYAQTFAILYLKRLVDTKDLRFDQELAHYAYRVTDRMKLYELLHPTEMLSILSPEFSEETMTISENTEDLTVEKAEETYVPEEETPITETGEEIPTEILGEQEVVATENQPTEGIPSENIEEVEPEIEVKQEFETAEIPTTEIEAADLSESPEETMTSSEISDENITINPLETKENPLDEAILDENILTSALDTIFPKIVEKSIPDATNEEAEEISSESEEFESAVENSIEIPEPKIEETNSNERSFMSWLTSQNGENPNISDKTNDEVASEETSVKNIEKIDELADKISIDQPIENRQSTIIDTFIEKNPSIQKPKSEFFSASKKAKQSVDESGLVYSETLASIFELQGNFPLAIKAYQQLCLTIPEKKVIFAKKIEQLEKKLN